MYLGSVARKVPLCAVHYLLTDTSWVMVYLNSVTSKVLLRALHYLLPDTYWVIAVQQGKCCCVQYIICTKNLLVMVQLVSATRNELWCAAHNFFTKYLLGNG
jgi:hypothetical protein